jgi:dTMP kinase
MIGVHQPPRQREGLFITVEGIEGVGKSTQVKLIADYLRSRDQSVVETREPGGTVVGELIREVVLNKAPAKMAPTTELLLMFAARAEHLDKVICPALAAGHCVVSDRFTDASYAYQGAGRGIAQSRIAILEDYVQGSLRPDLTLLLDAPVDIALARANHRGVVNRFEEDEDLRFFEAVRKGYLELARIYSDRFRVVDATQPIDKLMDQIRGYLTPLLP